MLEQNFWDKEGFNLTNDVVRPFEAEVKHIEALKDRFAVLDRLVQALGVETYRAILLRRCEGSENEVVGYIVHEYVKARTELLRYADAGKETLAARGKQAEQKALRHVSPFRSESEDFATLLKDLHMEQNELK